MSCKDRVVSEVTFLNHHILPSPWLQRLVPFHLCQALRHWSLHSSFAVLPSLTHSLAIKLTLLTISSFPVLHTFYSSSLPLQTAIFNKSTNCWMSLSLLIRNASSCELKREKSLLSAVFFSNSGWRFLYTGVAVPSLSSTITWHRHGTLYTG